jgi:hypothetical protein
VSSVIGGAIIDGSMISRFNVKTLRARI